MAREDPQMKLRLPEELKAKIAKAAEASGRSLNAEIVIRLNQSVEQEGEWEELKGYIEEAEKKFEDLFLRLRKLEDTVSNHSGILASEPYE